VATYALDPQHVGVRTLKNFLGLARFRGALRPYPGGVPQEDPPAIITPDRKGTVDAMILVALRVADKQQLKIHLHADPSQLSGNWRERVGCPATASALSGTAHKGCACRALGRCRRS
jgi:hypothetical protein